MSVAAAVLVAGQVIDPPQDTRQSRPRDRDFGQLEDDVAAVAHDPADPAATTPVPGAPLSGLGCTLQDIFNQVVQSPNPCVPVTLARAVTLAVRSLQIGGDLMPQEPSAIRIAATQASCP